MDVLPPKIDLLPEHLIDQIKAGEVIERPGNLIKEILENSIDAGSTKLELTLKNNGLDLISLKDNGHGMKFSDLPLAFSRHATSKISRFEDLYRLQSFGFRGEALASIAAISKLQCLTKTAADHKASEIKIEGGITVFHGDRQNFPYDHGTELVIQDLFFNTPVRLKFIQSQQSEKNFIKKIIFAFILCRPEIEFHFKLDDSEKEIYPARKTANERIQDIFSKARDLISHAQRFYENNELDIFIVPGNIKGPQKIQNIYINHRFILDKQLHRVISNALMATFGNDDFHYVAYFHLPPDTIDVNVHPNKTIIKVMESSKMISLLTSTVKELRPKQQVQAPTFQHQPVQQEASFFQGTEQEMTLQQEKHHYNMEGFFSPHRLHENKNEGLTWIGNCFLKNLNDTWMAVSANKLLENYTKARLEFATPSIPLLVSEPFNAKGVKKDIVIRLNEAGLELDYLSSDTIVLRGIPEWMNGFQLNGVVSALLKATEFSEIEIVPSDWSESQWEEMFSFFSVDELISKKIMIDLGQILREKFR